MVTWAGAWTGRAHSPNRRQWHVALASDLGTLERARCPDVPPSQIREREVGRPTGPAERHRLVLSVRATNAGPAAQHSEAMRGAARRQAHRPLAESAVLRVARRAAVSDKGSGCKVPPTANEARAKGRCHSCTCTEREGQSRICRGRQRAVRLRRRATWLHGESTTTDLHVMVIRSC